MSVVCDFLIMVRSYFEDVKYYYEKGDYVIVFVVFNYVYGFIDVGVRFGVFKGEDDRFFVFG